MPVECERANFLSVSDSENVQLHTESPAANRPQPLSALPCNFFETLKDRSDLNVTPTVQLETRSRAPSTHLNPFRIDVLWLRWYWEIGACLGSLAAFLSIFGLLKAYDGKTQPNWQYDITLNSVISWLAAIMKGMLLVPAASCISQSTWIYYTSRAHSLEILSTYDSASRGPWGSVQLLWALRARRLVCMGALLTVLAVGVDPTIQQAVVIRTRTIASAEPASLPRSQYFLSNPDDKSNYPDSFRNPSETKAIGALYSGLFSASINSRDRHLDVIPTCPTGNCTFPVFQSLAICTSCKNITYAVEKSCSTQYLYPYADSRPFNLCQLSIPNGLKINQTLLMDPGKNEDFAHDSIASTCDLPLVEADEYDDAFLNMAVLKSQIAEDGSAPVSATQCVLYWCINTYETRVLGGQLIEKTLDSWKSTTGGPSISDEIRTLTPPPVNPTIAPSNFTLDLFEVEKLSSRLATSLNFSNSYALQEIADSNEKLRVPDVSNRIDYTGIPANYNLIRLFQDYDTVDIIQNLAKSMTTHIRSVDNSKVTSESYAYLNITADGPVKGTVYHLQVYVAIRWLWLAFPACLLIFTFLFFVLVVIQSAFSGVAVWKSSPLAILFHGLSSSSVEQIQGATELADMEKHAKGMKVRFQDAHLAAVSEE